MLRALLPELPAQLEERSACNRQVFMLLDNGTYEKPAHRLPV